MKLTYIRNNCYYQYNNDSLKKSPCSSILYPNHHKINKIRHNQNIYYIPNPNIRKTNIWYLIKKSTSFTS